MAFQLTAIKQLGPLLLTTGVQTLYTVPASTTLILKNLQIYNDSGATDTVRIWFVPTAGSPTATNKVFEKTVLSKASVNLDDTGKPDGYVLVAGDTIQVQAVTGTTINIRGAGAEFQNVT